MTLRVEDSDFRLFVGDAREQLANIDDGTVDCVVTSPPYFGLRDYGTGRWEGGDPGCEHAAAPARSVGNLPSGSSTLTTNNGRGPQPGDKYVAERHRYADRVPAGGCPACGAVWVDDQIGLEKSPDEYVANLVGIFREVRRVLAPHGTVWLNIGDSYASEGVKGSGGMGKSTLGAGSGGHGISDAGVDRSQVRQQIASRKEQVRDNKAVHGEVLRPPAVDGLAPKQRMMIPARLALALQDDGWWIRSEIVWDKLSPMPESVTDRPTNSHEMVYMLVKGQWKSRVVLLADLDGERVHLGERVGSKHPDAWAHEFGVRLATAVFDRAQFEDQLGLPPLDSEVWQHGPDERDGVQVRGLPVEHRAAVFAARLLSTNAPAKEFLCELDRLGLALSDDRKLLILGGAAEFPLPPGVDTYGKAAIAIHDSGEVGEFDLLHHAVKVSWPSGCSYFYDRVASLEPYMTVQPGSGRPDLSDHPTLDESLEPEAAPSPDGRRKTTVRQGENSVQHRDGERWPHEGRNMRSVWRMPTANMAEAHFAVFPEELVRKALTAGCPTQVCRVCGKPRVRVVETLRPAMQTMRQASLVRLQGSGAERMGGTDSTTFGVEPPAHRTVAWSDCGCATGLAPDDYELIESPTGEGGDDPSLLTGRKGMNRERPVDGGVRPITRYEQRQYACQLAVLSKGRRRLAEKEAGVEAFAHYLRTDDAGARPIPHELLANWIGKGWLEVVEVPEPQEGDYRPGLVLDPFMGAGTTALVARKMGLHAVGVELSPKYAEMIERRLQQLSLFA